jgi:hypothetical protein
VILLSEISILPQSTKNKITATWREKMMMSIYIYFSEEVENKNDFIINL